MSKNNEFNSSGNFKDNGPLKDELIDLLKKNLKPHFDKRNKPFPEEKLGSLANALSSLFPPPPLSLEQFKKMSSGEKLDTIKNLSQSLRSYSNIKLGFSFYTNYTRRDKRFNFSPTSWETVGNDYVKILNKFQGEDLSHDKEPEPDTFLPNMRDRTCDRSFFPLTVVAFELNKKVNSDLDSCSFIEATIVAIEKVLEIQQSPKIAGFKIKQRITVFYSLIFLQNFLCAYLDYLDNSSEFYSANQFPTFDSANQFPTTEQTLIESYSKLLTLNSFQNKLDRCDLANSNTGEVGSSTLTMSELASQLSVSLLDQVSSPQSFLVPVNEYIKNRVANEQSQTLFEGVLDDMDNPNKKNSIFSSFPALSSLQDRGERVRFRNKMTQIFASLEWHSYYKPEITLTAF